MQMIKKTGVRVGQATLKSQVALKEMKAMSRMEIWRVLKAKVWNLGSRWVIAVSKVNEQWRRLLGCIDSSINTQLWVHVNQRQNIITEINHISFPHLLELYLGFNCIRSVQTLAQVNAPLLRFLSVRYNVVIQIRTLRKTHFFALATLWLDGNHIPVADSLNELKQPHQLQDLRFQDSEFNCTQNQDESVVVKLEARKLRLLYMQSKKRVPQQKVRRKLVYRFPALQINSLE